MRLSLGDAIDEVGATFNTSEKRGLARWREEDIVVVCRYNGAEEFAIVIARCRKGVAESGGALVIVIYTRCPIITINSTKAGFFHLYFSSGGAATQCGTTQHCLSLSLSPLFVMPRRKPSIVKPPSCRAVTASDDPCESSLPLCSFTVDPLGRVWSSGQCLMAKYNRPVGSQSSVGDSADASDHRLIQAAEPISNCLDLECVGSEVYRQDHQEQPSGIKFNHCIPISGHCISTNQRPALIIR
ncbi:hypothetical protein MUK42_29179 [Musa troglodytarum]|uniref:Uncharacterized protein n=1 Tax=Musa troglodytarum TaxID=320322 RepID=A0A9E7FHC5_9LILI|nr:hypothetical protein MUK42_29179 [Musa troglodytarum]